MWKTMMFPLALALAVPSGVRADITCGLHHDIVAQLAGQYQERPVAIGISDNGRLLQVLSSADGATWTVIVTTPQGISCVLATGQSWQSRSEIAFLPNA